MVRALAYFLFFALAAENYAEIPFEGRWETPFRPLGELLYRASPIKAPGIAVVMLGLLLVARSKPAARSGRSSVLDRALWLNLSATVVLLVWGLARGGAFLQALMQVQTLLFLPVSGFLFSAGLRSEDDFRLMGKAIVLAALYRATLALYFCFVVAPGLGVTPATMTTHADTILFTTGFVTLTSWALEERTKKVALQALCSAAYLLLAIHFNNRRLAYVCLVGALLLLYLLLEPGVFKRKLNRALLILAPIAALYLAAGWSSDSPIFKPAKAFSSMVGEKQDASSQTRDIENYNLIVTLRQHMIAGSGWGHEYSEVSVAYSIEDAFSLYRYIPHNSVLGLWAFSGYLGSTALWLVFVVAAYLSARAYRFADTPLSRSICAVSLCAIVIFELQAYGDMGLSAWNGNMIMGVAFAAASRMAASFGALDPALSEAGEDGSEERGSHASRES